MLEWLVDGVGEAGAAAIGGRLGDIFGRKRVLLIVVGLCGIGSLMSGATNSLPMMIAGRAVQGVSGAILPLCYSIAREVLPRENVPFWIGCLTGAYAALTGVGYLLGGVLSDAGSWHSIFYFAAAYAGLLLLVASPVLPDSRPAPSERESVDIVGGLLFVPGIAATLIGVSGIGQWGWFVPATWVFMLGGIVILAIWARYELHCPNPLVDVRLLLDRDIRSAIFCQALNGLGLVHVPLIMMLLIQQPVWTGVGLGLSASIAGLLKLPSNVGSAIASPISGMIFGRLGGRAAVMSAAAVSLAAWTYLFFRHGTVIDLIVGTTFAVAGCAMVLSSVPNLVLQATSERRSGEATGLAGTALGVFSAVGTQICATLLTVSRVVLTDDPSAKSFPSEFAYQLVMGYIMAICLALLLLGSRISRRVVADPVPTALPPPAAISPFAPTAAQVR